MINDCLRNRPAFRLNGASISVLQTPSEFYDTIISEIGRAQRRVSLAALYIGTDWKEKHMMEAVHAAVQKNKDLRVSVCGRLQCILRRFENDAIYI